MTELDSRRREFSASIRHLKVFESVAHLQGFQRASEECHLSQPAVTQAIAKLEEQLGVSLLVRRASGSYLNDIGVVFHRRMQRLFAQMEQALLELGVPNGPVPVSQLAARMSRSQIRSLIAIAENGSFAQAARALDISQTSLQRSARDLERTLRTPLYNQTASGVVATQAAVEFARKLKLALREIDWGVDEVEAARGNVGGEIVVGAMLLTGSVVIASVINEFVSTYPNAEVRIVNGNTGDLLKELRAGDVDVVVGLLRDQQSDGLLHRPLAETPYVIVGRHGHPLTEKGHVTLDDLAAFDWVVGTPASNRRIRFDRLFAGRRRPRARIETSSLPTMRLLLTQSDRLTLLTSYELMYEEEMLAAVPFGPIEPVPCIGLTTRENWLPTQLQTSFIELVQKRIVGSLMPVRELTRTGSARVAKPRVAPAGTIK
ncbi:MAG TPA: LysR substrate-binding domain-containing protein [Steroidobacteraceae bacterium]|jgi:DNA-binding transcriptional LysR family regulator|nr:LysR substrate-binding domain-containing protein [Steroidobacteraceae bacterium]